MKVSVLGIACLRVFWELLAFKCKKFNECNVYPRENMRSALVFEFNDADFPRVWIASIVHLDSRICKYQFAFNFSSDSEDEDIKI